MIYAGFWKRAVAIIIDTIILSVALAPFSLLMGWHYFILSSWAISVILNWLYFSLFESGGWMATPGKRLLGIKVTNLSGHRITFGKATGRYFAKILSALILCIGYLMAAFTKRKQALHDIIADTLVINNGSSSELSDLHLNDKFNSTQTIVVNRNQNSESEKLVLAGFDSNGHVVRLSFDFEDPKLYLEGLYLGRDSSSCDLHIRDQSISRRHARLFKKDGDIWIEDLGSTNGIIVNGRSIEGNQSTLLNLKGTLIIGGIQLALGKD
jgi:uncharacterized RDD family membrane protein YckC